MYFEVLSKLGEMAALGAPLALQLSHSRKVTPDEDKLDNRMKMLSKQEEIESSIQEWVAL